MLKLKLRYFGHLLQRKLMENTLMQGRIESEQEEKVTTEDEMVEWHH